MPRPDTQTNPRIIEETVRAVGPWFEVHEEALAAELGDDFDGVETANDLADALQQAQRDFEREQLEDKDLTTDRNTLITQVQAFVRSLRASIQRRLMAHEPTASARVLSDFTSLPPSHIRSIKIAREQLFKMSNALEVHKDMLRQGGRDRTRQWQSSIKRQIETLQEVSLRLASESRETAQAREARQKTLQDAVDFLQGMQLSAQAITIDSQAPLNDLNVLFDTFNLPTPTRNAPETPDEPPVEPGEDA